ncbi:MAG: ATP-binding protein [Desulfobacterales bacterium]|nr:ATP-binding protein [Desulfobacterales bacterium]
MRPGRLSLQQKFIFTIALIIIPTLGGIFIWAGYQHQHLAERQLVDQARVLAKQVILTRQWISDSQGVLVNTQSKGAREANPMFTDSFATESGHFIRFTPSMVTKALSEYSKETNAYWFRVVSRFPLNPKNRPTPYELKALHLFSTGEAQEAWRFGRMANRDVFQYMAPLYMDAACLKCHRQDGFDEKRAFGSLCIYFPDITLGKHIRFGHTALTASGIFLIGLVIIALFFLLKRMVITPLTKLKTMAELMGEGDYNARVELETGDEIQELGQAFNRMGDDLKRHHEKLEQEVERATRELCQANNELKTLDQLKSDFLANMSHELRSPLTSIKGGLDYLLRTATEEKQKNYLSIMDKNLGRLIHLVSDIFDHTRIEAGTASWNFEAVDLSELALEASEIMAHIAQTSDVRLTVVAPEPVMISGDLERLEQVLVNLLDNAIKFSPSRREVTLSVHKDHESAYLSVEDEGPGISEDLRAKIFKKFHTLPSSGKGEKPMGTGLGLFICKKIAEAHGGDISCEAPCKKKGARMVLKLPLKQPTVVHPQQPPPPY